MAILSQDRQAIALEAIAVELKMIREHLTAPQLLPVPTEPEPATGPLGVPASEEEVPQEDSPPKKSKK